MHDAVIFDFDGTLVDYRHGDYLAISDMLSLLPSPICQDDFYEYSKRTLYAIYGAVAQAGDDIHRTRLKASVEHFGLEWKEPYLAAYLEVYVRTVRVFDGAERFLSELSRRHPLGLLTNSIDAEEQKQRIACSGLATYFSSIGIARDIGFYKPDIAAFSWSSGSLNTLNENCVFIGDSEHYDIIGAKNSGMYAIKKISPAIVGAAEPTVADAEFREFGELGSMLATIMR